MPTPIDLVELSTLVEQMTDAGFCLSVDSAGEFRYTRWNPACQQLTGLPAEAVIGKTPIEALGPEMAAHFEARYRECTAARAPVTYDEAVVVRGSVETARTRLVPIVQDGRVTQLVGVSTNIGRAERDRVALLHSDERYRQLIEALQEGVWAIDVDANTTFVNPSMARMLGYSVEEMRGRHLFSFMSEASVKAAKENLARRAAGISEQHSFTFLHKSGSEVEVLLETSPLRDAEGKNIGALAGVLDVTAARRSERERAALERKMLETQRLESLGLMAGGIAHDFNNLLTAILIDASMGKESPEGAGELFGNIERAGRLAAAMCRQLLAYSGRGRFDTLDLDLSELVRDATELVRMSIAKTATLRFELAPKGLAVRADAAQLRQIVVNLVLNASEALSAPGTIVIRTRGQRLDAPDLTVVPQLPAGDYAVIEVIDEGVGMAPEQLAHIFDPFYSTKFTGRGLGLSAVMGIVRGHSGAVRVVSELQRGTHFHVFLPRSETETETAAAVPPPPEAVSGSGLVLVVDDEAMVRSAALRVLARLGFTTIEAEDGAEGVTLFEKHAEQLVCVLLDLTMPKLAGAAALRLMRKIRPTVPIVVMSGFDESEASSHFADGAHDGFIHKPFDLAAVRETLGKVFELHRR